MNARTAAVALSSCLSLVLVSQLYPWPSLSRLVASSPHGVAPRAEGSGSPVVVAATELPRAVEPPQPAEAPQATETPRVATLPQTVAAVQEAQVSSTEQASAATTPPHAVETQQAAQEPQAPQPEADAKPEQTANATPPSPAPEKSGTLQADAADVVAPRPVDATIPEAAPAASAATPTTDQPETSRPDVKVDIASASPTDMLGDEQPLPDHPAELPPSNVLTNTLAPANSAVAVDDCIVDGCIDRYLWALYQRAPKEDKVRVDEQRMVAVKRKGKIVMVSRTFTKLVDEDFTWKDQKASDKAGMPIDTYVVGGMDAEFRLKLFRILHAADIAGLAPGITSAFRDDYRQSIASGLKAANNRSFHGGSTRGGYGHGLAADVVSVKGATRVERWAATETLWKWIDANAQQFGIGRPYLGYDPPHLAPTDGDEWARHHHEPSVRVAAGKNKTDKNKADKKATRLAAHHTHGSAKRLASGKSKASTVRAARNAPYRTAQAKLHG